MAEILTYEDFGGPPASAVPVEKTKKTPEVMGKDLDRKQDLVIKLGGSALGAGEAEKRIDNFWTPEREAKVEEGLAA